MPLNEKVKPNDKVKAFEKSLIGDARYNYAERVKIIHSIQPLLSAEAIAKLTRININTVKGALRAAKARPEVRKNLPKDKKPPAQKPAGKNENKEDQE